MKSKAMNSVFVFALSACVAVGLVKTIPLALVLALFTIGAFLTFCVIANEIRDVREGAKRDLEKAVNKLSVRVEWLEETRSAEEKWEAWFESVTQDLKAGLERLESRVEATTPEDQLPGDSSSSQEEGSRRQVDHEWPDVGTILEGEYRGNHYEAEVIAMPRYKSGKAIRVLNGPAAGEVERSMSGAMLAATERVREENDLGRKGVSNGWHFWKIKSSGNQEEALVDEGNQDLGLEELRMLAQAHPYEYKTAGEWADLCPEGELKDQLENATSSGQKMMWILKKHRGRTIEGTEIDVRRMGNEHQYRYGFVK